MSLFCVSSVNSGSFRAHCVKVHVRYLISWWVLVSWVNIIAEWLLAMLDIHVWDLRSCWSELAQSTSRPISKQSVIKVRRLMCSQDFISEYISIFYWILFALVNRQPRCVRNDEPMKFICLRRSTILGHFLWPPCVADADIIFLPGGFFFLLSFFLSSPNLNRRRLDIYHTSTHGVALVRI